MKVKYLTIGVVFLLNFMGQAQDDTIKLQTSTGDSIALYKVKSIRISDTTKLKAFRQNNAKQLFLKSTEHVWKDSVLYFVLTSFNSCVSPFGTINYSEKNDTIVIRASVGDIRWSTIFDKKKGFLS